MSYYPLYFELSGVPVLIAGGGRIAFHKAELLSSRGALVSVVAPDICKDITALNVRTVKRRVREEDAHGAAMVIDATGDPDARDILRAYCKEHSVPYNCAWNGEDTTLMFPAVYEQGHTSLAVSTLGASPAAAARLRDYLADCLPGDVDSVLGRMSQLRKLAKENISSQANRSAFLHECFGKMIESKKLISDEEAKLLLKKNK